MINYIKNFFGIGTFYVVITDKKAKYKNFLKIDKRLFTHDVYGHSIPRSNNLYEQYLDVINNNTHKTYHFKGNGFLDSITSIVAILYTFASWKIEVFYSIDEFVSKYADELL